MLPEKSFQKVLVQIVQALNYLSESRIFHRDIKPANILLTKKNLEESTIKICDFGLAKQLENGVDFTNSIVGTPIYFPPEKLRKNSVGESGDIWSLGCVAYELLVRFFFSFIC